MTESKDGCTGVSKDGRTVESLEGKAGANSSYHALHSSHLGEGILLKASERRLATHGVGELILTTAHSPSGSPSQVGRLFLASASVLPSSLPPHTSGQAFQPLAVSVSLAHYIREKARTPGTHQLCPAPQHNPTAGGTACQPAHLTD